MDTGTEPAVQSGEKKPQILAASAATLGALAMGMVIGWSSPVQPKINDAFDFEVTGADFSWIGSVVPLGAAFSCIPTGIIVNLIGRKRTMLYISAPFVLGWIFIIWPAAVEMLIVGRFITGFCGGVFSVASPMYISEIAETNVRGILSSFFQLLLCIGVELSYIIGAYTPVLWFSVICAITPVIFAACFFFVPETPQYLIRSNRHSDAKNALQWFRGPAYNPELELKMMTVSIEEDKKNKVAMIDIFKDPTARKGLLILLGVIALQQFSGINAVIFYSNNIFEAAGSQNPKISAIIVGGVMALSTVPATLVVDKAGRKFLLIVSAVGMAIFITILGFYFFFDEQLADEGWLPLSTLVLYIFEFSIGAGPVTWFIAVEIFSPQLKGPASGLGACSNWGIAFLVTKFYGPVSVALGIYTTYWFFGLCCVLGALHVYFFVPETKGKTTDEILRIIEGKKGTN